MDDNIKKIDEEIEDLKNYGKHGHIEEEVEDTETKTFDMDNYEDEEVEEVHETREERLEKKEKELEEVESREARLDKKEDEEEKVDKKKEKKKKKKWPFIVIGVVLLLIIIIVVVILLLKDNKKVEKDTTKKLSAKEQKEIINGYGEAVEGVIEAYYTNQNVLLEFDDAAKLVEYKHKVKCSVSEVYKDGKLYLNKCKIDGIKTKYSYGEEQKEPEFNGETSFKVYIANDKASLSEIDDAKEYIVNTNGKYSDPELLFKKTDMPYVSWYDEGYNVHIANYVEGREVLGGITYDSILPIKEGNNYTDYAALLIGNKYAIYDFVNNKKITSTIYNYIISNYGMGVSGPPKFIPTIDNTSNVIGITDANYRVINYKTGNIILDGESIRVRGNYLAVGKENGNGIDLYDLDGNQLLKNKYDMIYDIVDGYVLVNKDNHLLLVNTNGKMIEDFGDDKIVSSYNFGVTYNDGVVFQFSKANDNGKCYEYIYSKKDGMRSNDVECWGIAKPMLYLYPKKTTNVIVTFEHPELLETTYPKFNDKWSVKAHSNGDLYDKNGKYYYGLYWDEKQVHKVDFSTGFYVEDKDAIEFLEEKLDYIGLNRKEANEFITYWLPKLEKNKKSLVYFELTEERNSYNRININPKPDTLLRVVIHIKKVDKKVDIKKESLTHTARRGFVAVEWGGTTY